MRTAGASGFLDAAGVLHLSTSTGASMTGAATFDGTSHNISRTAGSFLADGFVPGMRLSISGSALNGGSSGVLSVLSVLAVTDLVITTTLGPLTSGSMPSGLITESAGSVVIAGDLTVATLTPT